MLILTVNTAHPARHLEKWLSSEYVYGGLMTPAITHPVITETQWVNEDVMGTIILNSLCLGWWQ